MFEEVPCERRGLNRLLPVRRIVLGPFVLGGGMLLAALGGSVAVAAAATVLTASVISSDDVPPRPAPVLAPSHSATSHPAMSHSATSRPGSSHPAAINPAANPAVTHPAAPVSPAQRRPARPPSSAATPAGRTVPAPDATAPSGSAVTPAPTNSASPGSPPVADGPAVPSSAPPSSSGPRGNAVIHLSGYNRATGRFVYQFATAVPQDPDAYVVSGRQSFTAALAPAATITSGGTLCPPAGSRCTPDQLIAAADSGFFAEVAIDVTGALRSVVEVGHQAATPKLLPVPSVGPGTATTPPGSPGDRSPRPTASPAASS